MGRWPTRWTSSVSDDVAFAVTVPPTAVSMSRAAPETEPAQFIVAFGPGTVRTPAVGPARGEAGAGEVGPDPPGDGERPAGDVRPVVDAPRDDPAGGGVEARPPPAGGFRRRRRERGEPRRAHARLAVAVEARQR